MSRIDETTNTIVNWEQVRNSPKAIINYVNQDSCFIIGRKGFAPYPPFGNGTYKLGEHTGTINP